MIFVTVGSCMKFDRLLKRVSELSPDLNEKIIMQTGCAEIQAEYCECFTFEPDIHKYYEQARIIISHGGFATLEVLKFKKPLLIVPRQQQYGEHHDNHQVEFAELLNQKYGVKYVMDINNLNIDIIKNYTYIADFNSDNLKRFREKIYPILQNNKHN